MYFMENTKRIKLCQEAVYTQSAKECDKMQTTYSVCFKNSISTLDGVALN